MLIDVVVAALKCIVCSKLEIYPRDMREVKTARSQIKNKMKIKIKINK